MDARLWISIAIGLWVVWMLAKALDKGTSALARMRSDRQQEIEDLGRRIDALAHELYLIRRIAERQTGITEQEINDGDRREMDAKFDALRQAIAESERHAASGNAEKAAG